jgi:hypothetical protein
MGSAGATARRGFAEPRAVALALAPGPLACDGFFVQPQATIRTAKAVRATLDAWRLACFILVALLFADLVAEREVTS